MKDILSGAPLFEGSARLEKKDFIKAEKLIRRGTVTWILVLVSNIFTGLILALHLLSLFILQDSAQREQTAYYAATAALLFGLSMIMRIFLGYVSGVRRASAPMNKNRTARVRFYVEGFSYTDEFVVLTASYQDVSVIRIKSGVMVFLMDGADYVFIPTAAFGGNEYALLSFLKNTLKGKVKA